MCWQLMNVCILKSKNSMKSLLLLVGNQQNPQELFLRLVDNAFSKCLPQKFIDKNVSCKKTSL